MMVAPGSSLGDWLEECHPPPGLTSVVRSISASCAQLSDVLRTAALSGLSGSAGTTNVQGETQKALDVLANEIFVEALTSALFQLDPVSREFRLLEPNLRIASDTPEYAINHARSAQWDGAISTFTSRVAADSRYNMRWTGSMVADALRILNRGGTFLYPAGKTSGPRLRLLYEAAPIAMIVEAAGGKASTGWQDILDVLPTAIHQRVSVIFGSSDEVDRICVDYAATVNK